MKQSIIDAILHNEEQDRERLQRYCNYGENQEKLFEILTLGQDENDLRNPNNSGLSAISIAAKNGCSEFLKFFITSALATPEGKKLIAGQLLALNREGRTVLHASTFRDNDSIIDTLCFAAETLASQGYKELKNYVDVREQQFGSTSLHMAARQCNSRNYHALRRAGADVNARSKDGMKPLDLVKSNHPDVSVPFMKDLILNTEEGADYFVQRFGQSHKLIPDNILTALIEIDFDSGLTTNPRAQLNAFENCMKLLSAVKTPKEIGVLLAAFENLHLSILSEDDLKGKNSGPVQMLRKALSASSAEKDTILREHFIHAEILSQLKGFPGVTAKAFANYITLMDKYPEVTSAKLHQLDLKSPELNPTLLAQSLVKLQAAIQLKQIQNNPTPKSFLDMFRKDSNKFFIETLQTFCADIHKTASIDQVCLSINALPDDKLFDDLKNKMLQELHQVGLLAPTHTPKSWVNR